MNQVLEKIERINAERFSAMNGRPIISVSKLKEYVIAPFEKEKQAKACAEKGKNDPNYKYHGMTAEKILQAWEDKAAESRQYGTWSDEYAEQLFTGDDKSMKLWKLDHNFDNDSRLKNNCLGISEFYDDIKKYGYEYVGREITVYGQSPSELRKDDMPMSDEPLDNVVVGRIDCLFYHPVNNKYLIVDWKSTDDIKTTAFAHRKMKGPAMNWEDCNMGEYTIQLHIYKNDLVYTYQLAEENDVSVCVCNLLKAPNEHGKHYILFKENFDFSHQTIEQVVDFSIYKRTLIG